MSYEKHIMEYKGYKAQIMEAPRLVGETNFGLPPGHPIAVYPVDAFIKIPENWMKGPGVFVVPVRKDKGLWFDFRQNSEINTAVIMTVKGCNPITGLQTSGFHLEKYDDKCPKHGCNFLAERFCSKCNYKWPDRNFLSGNPLWWDVWKTADGVGRQFYFTEDELKDIATHKIGAENTVPAFGFAFYSPKVRRLEAEPVRGYGYGHPIYLYQFPQQHWDSEIHYYGRASNTTSQGFITNTGSYTAATGVNTFLTNEVIHSQELKLRSDTKCSCNFMSSNVPEQNLIGRICTSEDVHEDTTFEKRDLNLKETKEVSVGAGAKINQELPVDSYPLDTWKDTPDAVMTVYFVFQEKFEELRAGGIRDLEGVKEGMLEGLPVG